MVSVESALRQTGGHGDGDSLNNLRRRLARDVRAQNAVGRVVDDEFDERFLAVATAAAGERFGKRAKPRSICANPRPARARLALRQSHRADFDLPENRGCDGVVAHARARVAAEVAGDERFGLGDGDRR